MKKKLTEKAKSRPEYDSQRETRVLLEDIDKSVKTVAEQHDSIIKKLDEHDEHFDRIESELGSVGMAVAENGRKIKKLEEGQERLEKGQEEIKQKLDTVTTDHERRLQKLETMP